MGAFKRFAVGIYLLAATLSMGVFAASLWGPFTARAVQLLALPTFRMLIALCLLVCALQLLYLLARMIVDRPEPRCIHLASASDVEVSLSALESAARIAARDGEALIEDVRCRVARRDPGAVRVSIDAIALTEVALDKVAARIQARVADALDGLLGAPSATVRVRFLPSKTTTETREVFDE